MQGIGILIASIFFFLITSLGVGFFSALNAMYIVTPIAMIVSYLYFHKKDSEKPFFKCFLVGLLSVVGCLFLGMIICFLSVNPITNFYELELKDGISEVGAKIAIVILYAILIIIGLILSISTMLIVKKLRK